MENLKEVSNTGARGRKEKATFDFLACPHELYGRLLQTGVNLFKRRFSLTGAKCCLVKGFLESGPPFPEVVNVIPSIVKHPNRGAPLRFADEIRGAPKLDELTLHHLRTGSLCTHQFGSWWAAYNASALVANRLRRCYKRHTRR